MYCENCKKVSKDTDVDYVINTVAIVSGGSPDYLIDIVADGMIRFLGNENVYIRYFWLKPGISEERRVRHLYVITKNHENKISLSECQALVASNRVSIDYIKKYKQIRNGIVAIVDGEDSGELKDEYLRIADVYFKREYFRDGKYPVKVLNSISSILPRGRRLVPSYYKRYPDKVHNLSFGVVPIDYGSGDENPEKTGNLFFAGGSGGARALKIRQRLKDLVGDYGTFMPNVLEMKDYAREVRRHWICLVPRGSGWDTYRYWEIPYLGGAMLCQNHPLKIDDDFVHGESCLRFSTVDEARSLIEEFLQRKDKLAYIANKGRELVIKKHLSIHRAMKVCQTIAERA
jgi:hypothetical protein